jgi:glucokinase
VHEDCGWLIFAPGLEQRNVDIVAGLTSRMPGANIFVDNDVNCATLAEYRFGRGQKFKTFICVFVGTGVGAGIVIEGHLHRGIDSAAGEIGHMRIDMADDALLCKCGRRGCLEEYASARAITRMARERINSLCAANDVTPERFIECLRQGESNAIPIATEFARNLSIRLGNAVDILNPEAVILGGGIIEALMDFDFFRNALKIGFKNNVLSITKDTPILEATYGNKSGMIGAAALAESKVMHGRQLPTLY